MGACIRSRGASKVPSLRPTVRGMECRKSQSKVLEESRALQQYPI